MQNPTRTWRIRVALLTLAFSACDPGPPPPSAQGGRGDRPDGATIAASPAWQVDTLAAAGFRAFGWGAGDTLWGIDRGRLAWATAAGARGRIEPIAWDVQTAPGVVSWTNDEGLWRRAAQGFRKVLGPDAAPGADYLGPEVLWSPDGSRALVSWSAEGDVAIAVLEADSVRALPGLRGAAGAQQALWIDSVRVLVRVVAHAPLAGPAGHRESGYRSDLVLLDVLTGAAQRRTHAADGEFHDPEGHVGTDSVLVGIRSDGAVPQRHAHLDIGSRDLASTRLPAGRAAAAHGQTALLRPAEADRNELAWQLGIVDRNGGVTELARVSGHAVRLIWHPERPMLAVAVESELNGTRTLVVSMR